MSASVLCKGSMHPSVSVRHVIFRDHGVQTMAACMQENGAAVWQVCGGLGTCWMRLHSSRARAPLVVVVVGE